MTDWKPGFAAAQFRLDGKRALITGGRGALAEAMAATLADLGCAVALASRTEADCADLAAGIADRFGVPAAGLACNIADEASVEATIARTVERLGGLDILINNAGASWWGLPQDIPLKGWQKVMDVNVTGPFLITRALLPMLKQSAAGRVVFFAGVAILPRVAPRHSGPERSPDREGRGDLRLHD